MLSIDTSFRINIGDIKPIAYIPPNEKRYFDKYFAEGEFNIGDRVQLLSDKMSFTRCYKFLHLNTGKEFYMTAKSLFADSERYIYHDKNIWCRSPRTAIYITTATNAVSNNGKKIKLHLGDIVLNADGYFSNNDARIKINDEYYVFKKSCGIRIVDMSHVIKEKYSI